MARFGIDLDKIQLPADDANKPAELSAASDEGVEDPTPPDAAAAAKAQADKEAVKVEDKPADEETQPADGKGTDTTPEPEATDTTEEQKLTPFHEHPDWKKMQDENHRLEVQLAEMKGQVSTLLTSSNITAEDKQVAIKTAEERIQEDLQKGWEPKDQLEISLRVAKYAKEELRAEEAAAKEQEGKATKAQQDRATQLQTRADQIFVESGITTADDKALVDKTANEWLQKGMVNSIEGLSVVIDYLKAKGQIGKAMQTTVVADDNTTKEQDKKQDVNSKITRPKGAANSSDEKNQPAIKLEFKRKPTLDDIVLQGGKALG